MPKHDPDYFSSDDLDAIREETENAVPVVGKQNKEGESFEASASKTAAENVVKKSKVGELKGTTRADLVEKLSAKLRSLGADDLAEDIEKAFASGKFPLPKFSFNSKDAGKQGKLISRGYMAEKYKGTPLEEVLMDWGRIASKIADGPDANAQRSLADAFESGLEKLTEKMVSAHVATKNATEVETPTTTTTKTTNPLNEAIKRQRQVKEYVKGASLTRESLDDPAVQAELEKLGISVNEVKMALGKPQVAVDPGAADAEKRRLAAAQQLEAKSATPTIIPQEKKVVEEVATPKKASWGKAFKKNSLLQMLVPTSALDDLKKAGIARQELKRIQGKTTGEVYPNELLPLQNEQMRAELAARQAFTGEAREAGAVAAKSAAGKLATAFEEPAVASAAVKALPKALTTRAALKAFSSIPGGILLGMLAGGLTNTIGEYTGLPITPENRAIQAQEELRPSLDDMMIQAEIEARQQDRAIKAIQNNPQLAAQLQSQARIEQATQQGRASHTYTIGGSTGFNSSASDLLSLVNGG